MVTPEPLRSLLRRLNVSRRAYRTANLQPSDAGDLYVSVRPRHGTEAAVEVENGKMAQMRWQKNAVQRPRSCR